MDPRVATGIGAFFPWDASPFFIAVPVDDAFGPGRVNPAGNRGLFLHTLRRFSQNASFFQSSAGLPFFRKTFLFWTAIGHRPGRRHFFFLFHRTFFEEIKGCFFDNPGRLLTAEECECRDGLCPPKFYASPSSLLSSVTTSPSLFRRRNRSPFGAILPSGAEPLYSSFLRLRVFFSS